MLHGIPDELRQFLADELAAEEAAAADEYRRLMERAAEEAKKPVYLSLATDWHRVRATVIEDESSDDEEEAFLSLAPGYEKAVRPQHSTRAKARAEALEVEHRKRALQRQQAAEKLAARHAKEKNAFRAKRRNVAAARETAEAEAREKKARAAKAEFDLRAQVQQQQAMAEEAAARERMKKVLEAEEVTMRRLHEKWRAHKRRAASGHDDRDQGFSGEQWWLDSDEDEDDEEEAVDSGAGTSWMQEEVGEAAYEEDESEAFAAWATEEIQRAREQRVAQRDAAVEQILSKESRTLHEALGLAGEAVDEAAVASRVRKLLKLLHPDYAINQALRGTKQERRIERAFKRLNALREQR